MKKAFTISGVFISGLIGAGFASGSEILFYFSKYGIYGLFGIIVTVFIFAAVEYIVILRAKKYGTHTLDSYFGMIMSRKFAFFASLLAYLFMILLFSAMLSGFGELLNGIIGIKKIYGVLIMLFCSHLILSNEYKGFIAAESILSVFIIITVICTGIYILLFRETSIETFNVNADWGISAVSYAGYNLLTSMAVLCVLGKDADKKTVLISSVLTFFFLFIILSMLWYIICIYAGMIPLGNMPVLTICMRQSQTLAYLYSAVIFVSMLTTAVSNAYALRMKMSDFISHKASHYCTLFLAFLISGFDFSFVVDKLYRAAGIISILVLFAVIKDFIKN